MSPALGPVARDPGIAWAHREIGQTIIGARAVPARPPVVSVLAEGGLMRVDILEQTEQGTQQRVATFEWRDGEIVCDNPVLWKNLMNSGGGVIVGARGKRYYPRDGLEYLRNLRFQYKGPYLVAGPVIDRDTSSETSEVSLAGEALAARAPGQILSSATLGHRPGHKTVEPRIEVRAATGMEPATTVRAAAPPAHGATAFAVGVELAPETLERTCGEVFRLNTALRGHAVEVARREADALFSHLIELSRIDAAELIHAFEGREEYLEMRFQPPSRTQYLRLWDRILRQAQGFLEVLTRGDLPEALWPLFMLREGLAGLGDHRDEWRSSLGLESLAGPLPVGIDGAHLEQSWQDVGVSAFRQAGLSGSLLEQVYGEAEGALQRGVERFALADFGQAEQLARRALLIDPGLVSARLLLGDILRRLDRTDEARVELQHVLELEQLSLRAHSNAGFTPEPFRNMARARVALARVFLNTGRVREAIAQLERALEALDQVTRRTPADAIGSRAWNELRQEQNSLHQILEPLCRATGDADRAEQHRRRMGPA